MRADQRQDDELRPLACELDINAYAEGSCIFSSGHTRVHCTATAMHELPRWRRESGLGWINAEYRMLPRATPTRSQREGRFDVKGRTAEIQRLVGRALRSVVDMRALGSRQIVIDCDVMQADGGTRTAAVNGGYIAMVMALRGLVQAGRLKRMPLTQSVAAVSVGLIDGHPMLDLAYDEDSRAQVDLNVIMTGDGRFVEVQGTAETDPFTRQELDALLDLARGGIEQISLFQAELLEGVRRPAR